MTDGGERTMHTGDHIDEGTIHAWLENALDAAPAERVARHVAGCATCLEAVGEARGLIAGASRVIRALDENVTSTIASARSVAGTGSAAARTWGAPSGGTAGTGTLWRILRVTPARAAIAATVLVALGITLTRQRTGPDALSEQSMRAQAPPSAASPFPNDHLLDSAIARNIAQAQPPRTVHAAPGPNVTTTPADAGGAVLSADESAPTRVATARALSRALSVTAAPAAEQSRTIDSPPAQRGVKADAIAAPMAASALEPSECYRVESSASDASWGPVTLPMIVALEGSGQRGRATILDSRAAIEPHATAEWSRSNADSLQLELRSPGYTGTLRIAGRGELRVGILNSTTTAPVANGTPMSAVNRAGSPVLARRINCEALRR